MKNKLQDCNAMIDNESANAMLDNLSANTDLKSENLRLKNELQKIKEILEQSFLLNEKQNTSLEKKEAQIMI